MENTPEIHFFIDDGVIPNSRYPVLIYKNAFAERGSTGAEWLEKRFEGNNWKNTWRNGIFPYHHYHSNTHEVLGIYNGAARLHLGGEQGEKIQVDAGDVIIIPAGVGHKNLESTEDFSVVGAYPDGMEYDILTGQPGDRRTADVNIPRVPFPSEDPILGNDKGLMLIWKG